jgi:hypothetical protein
MTHETIRTSSDAELAQVVAWVQQEQQARATQRKHETLAKIRELARSIEVGIKIEGTRGRPAGSSKNTKTQSVKTGSK